SIDTPKTQNFHSLLNLLQKGKEKQPAAASPSCFSFLLIMITIIVIGDFIPWKSLISIKISNYCFKITIFCLNG
ncbi:MAG: hypothetical protein V7K35_14975, partial [Nostoc sp.]|uniref:hypothetical protein n=1 Tax=Nostoc sp. TaxID=1180 RepID=UPI002FF7B87F